MKYKARWIGVFAWVNGKKRFEGESAGKDHQIIKREEALNTYEQWISLYQKGKRIADHLKRNCYHSVAVYGLGRIGRNLFDELESGFKIDYVIDRSISMQAGRYRSVLCYHPDAILPKTDLIIVTVSGEASNIISALRGCGSPMISIQDLIQQICSLDGEER